MTLEIDVHEPSDAMSLMGSSVACSREVLNEHQWGDYRWQCSDSSWVNVERKTWPEILASLDSVEDQLRRHKKNQPNARLIFVLEGMVSPAADGTYTLKETGQKLWVRGYKSGTRVGRILAWLYEASQFVEVFQTTTYEMTCQFLVQAYKQDQKVESEHKTFNRYFKKMTFHPNPQVLMLIGIMPGIGEVKAEAIIARFTTLWQVLNASPGELSSVPGIGDKTARTLLSRIGRLDV